MSKKVSLTEISKEIEQTQRSTRPAAVHRKAAPIPSGPPAPRREITEEEKRRRAPIQQQIAQEQALQARGPIPMVRAYQGAPLPKDPSAEASSVVLSTKNPFLGVYREFLAGQITREELDDAIDAAVCSDEKLLNSYQYQALPGKPEKLSEAEVALHRKTMNMDEMKKEATERAFYDIARSETFKRHYQEVDALIATNAGNKIFLEEILQRQTGKNALYCSKVRAVLDTHVRKGGGTL